ncbi:MAG: 3,4-dihydroxy-2-butanone-4-phosphate synthase [Xanthomonadaceae bacterium]|nr:3,4-dihydroxy-2-butanone-4-phosphate synthase [Xanthomonadaceae bacterium]
MKKIIDQLRAGKMIILVDDEGRENEGDLILSGELVTPEAIQFMAMHARGLICLAMSQSEIERLALPMMVTKNQSKKQTAFTVSIEAATGVTTGISAYDRALTVRVASDPASGPNSIISPGHIFPLKARENGVFTRQGHTEGSVDLMKLSGLWPSAVICEIIRDDGQMARGEDLEKFSAQWDIPIVKIHDLIKYRIENEKQGLYSAVSKLPTEEFGLLTIGAYEDETKQFEAIAIQVGDLKSNPAPLVRVHSECFTGDVLGSLKCDCGWQLSESLRLMGEAGSGVLVYLKQHEGRGIGIVNKIRAYALQDQGMDTVQANHALGLEDDIRNYVLAARVLKDLGVTQISLLTNNPIKIKELKNYGVTIFSHQSLEAKPNAHNSRYLSTKLTKMGHILNEIQGVWQ